MLKDRGSSLLYPILAKAASAFTSTEFRMVIAGVVKMTPVAESPDLSIGYQSSFRDHSIHANRKIDGIHARWSAAEISRGGGGKLVWAKKISFGRKLLQRAECGVTSYLVLSY